MAKRFVNVRKDLIAEVSNFLRALSGKEKGDPLSRPPQRDQRGRLAKAVDYLSLRLLFFAVFLFTSAAYLEFSLAATVSAAGLVGVHLYLNRKEKAGKDLYKQRLYQYTAKSQLYEQVMKMDPDKEFKIFISQVLNGLKGFSEMNTVEGQGGIDLTGKFNGVPVAVSCRRYKKENEVGKSELSRFASDMKKEGLTRGVFMTTSQFSDWAFDYVRDVRDDVRIVLVDKSKLLDWIRLSRHSINPADEDIERILTKQQEQERMVSLHHKVKRSRGLMRSFFLVTVYLTVLSFLMQGWLDAWMLKIYFSIAVANMLLGLVFYYLYRQAKDMIGETSALEQFK